MNPGLKEPGFVFGGRKYLELYEYKQNTKIYIGV